MKQRKKLMGLILFMFVFCAAAGVSVSHARSVQAAVTSNPKNQYVKKNGVWYYYDENGRRARGWYISAAGNRYYFDPKTGAAKAGILTISGKKYCFNVKGKMLVRWQKVGSNTYFFDSKAGYMRTGWYTPSSGNKYYFGADGIIRSGWQKVGSKQYYFNSKGLMLQSAFVDSGTNSYYLDTNGQKAKGRVKVGSDWYAFNRNTGVLVKNGWYKETDGSYYYAGEDGKLKKGWFKPDKYYRYFRKSDCKMLTGWQDIGGNRYYFKKSNGLRYDNCKLISKSGNAYYFSKTGKLFRKGFFTRSDGTYYAKSNGVLAVGWLTVDGNTYFMNRSPKVSNRGRRLTGWVTISGEKYYFNTSTGVMARSTWVDKEHYVGEDGAWIEGYQEANLRWPLASKYNYITSYFGNRESPGGIGSTNHGGIDIYAPTGTYIYAAASGVVSAKLSPSQSGGGGNYTVIDHGNGIQTEYMHQSKFAAGIAVGTTVKKGQLIGYVGTTGNVTGPHLHFGVIVNGVRRDPLKYVKQP